MLHRPDTHDTASYLWRRATNIQNTIAETYLRQARGYDGPTPPTFRFLPAHNGHRPALVCPYGLPGEIADDAVPGVHLIKLNGDGTDRFRPGKDDREPAKQTLGTCPGSPIVCMSFDDARDTDVLVIGEGVEDVLSATEAMSMAGWAAGGATRMPALAEAVPDHVSHVYILVDDNEAGRTNSSKLASILTLTREVEVFMVLFEGTDANKFRKDHGLDALRKEITRKAERYEPPPPADGNEKKKCVANPLNLRREFQSNALTNRLVGFNEFAQQVVLLRPVPRPDLKPPGKFEPRPWADADNTALAEHFNSRGFHRVGDNLIHAVVRLEAECNPFHPVRDYLDGLKWDGTERISGFLSDYCGAVVSDEGTRRYIEVVSRAFFISAVARIFSPGCQSDSTMIIEGPQGRFKSAMLRSLAVRDEWFTDSLPHDLSNKDARAHLAGKWIIEMGEIAQFKRSEIETVKSFLSCQIDRFRPPYGRSDISVPRQCTFVGTTNSDDYLLDATGNRRFWPVKITEIKLDNVREDIDQLWAEAVVAFKAGEKWHLSRENESLATEEQQTRTERDPWHDPIEDFMAIQTDGVTTARIFDRLGIGLDNRTRGDEMRIGRVLRMLGCERKRVMVDGKQRWLYRRGEQGAKASM